MMGRLDRDQGQFLYCFDLEEVVPEDHLVRAIAAVLDQPVSSGDPDDGYLWSYRVFSDCG
jgi:hypothetical protein